MSTATETAATTAPDTPPCPYEVLGVARDATKEQIAKAFRQRARVTHPDRNSGDDTEFKIVHDAYQLLSDDARRERYDRTGEWQEVKPDNGHVQTLMILGECLAAVIQELAKHAADIRRHDVVSLMRQAMKKELVEVGKQKHALQKAKDLLALVPQRVSCTQGENLLADIARAHSEQVEQGLRGLEKKEADLKAAMREVERFVCKVEPQDPWGAYTTAATSFKWVV